LLEYLPLVTVGGVCLLIASMLRNKRYEHQAHKVLIAFLVLAGLYALADVLFFTAKDAPTAIVIGRVDVSILSVAAFTLTLFPTTLKRPLAPKDILLYLMLVAGSIVLLPGTITGVKMRWWGWQAVYDTNALLLLGLMLNVLFAFVIVQFWRIFRQLKEQGSPHAPQVKVILLGFILFIVSTNVLNLVIEILMHAAPPLNSTFMIIPVGMIAYSFNRGKGRINCH